MVGWLCTKEIINERGPNILLFRSWCYSRKRGHSVGPRFHPFAFGLNQKQSESKIPLLNPSGGKLVLRPSGVITNNWPVAYLHPC